mmetsp:Transcript_23557/g.75118  ORF Transcript_23557/g.75118 Transcript_23557/m.75118 type:complete len:247 (+) Transcript_23557:484-1224(+)
MIRRSPAKRWSMSVACCVPRQVYTCAVSPARTSRSGGFAKRPFLPAAAASTASCTSDGPSSESASTRSMPWPCASASAASSSPSYTRSLGSSSEAGPSERPPFERSLTARFAARILPRCAGAQSVLALSLNAPLSCSNNGFQRGLDALMSAANSRALNKLRRETRSSRYTRLYTQTRDPSPGTGSAPGTRKWAKVPLSASASRSSTHAGDPYPYTSITISGSRSASMSARRVPTPAPRLWPVILIW